MAVNLKVNTGTGDAARPVREVLEGVKAAVRDLTDAAVKVKQVEVPIFVEKEVLI